MSGVVSHGNKRMGVFQLSWRPSRRLNSKAIYAGICLQKPSVLASKNGNLREGRPLSN